ncbi:MAG: Mor transcription activator family protein [Candidatus Subteraquimicrobiales bacterium]|nr:Mor transcription activator family protein [Candidatus Subteraquimicrobiales bacterium]
MKNAEKFIDQLPGDLRRIAEVIGVKPTLDLAKAFRGTYLYVHNLDDILREIRNEEIREEYTAGKTKVNTLAIKHQLTERQIWNILGEEPEGDTHPFLLNLLK